MFTVADELKPLFLANQRLAYGLLFAAVAETLLEVAANPRRLGAQIGFTAVLHTWTQRLLYHPHIHCIVAGGGLSPDGQRWMPTKPGFFLPVRVLSEVFRGKLLDAMRRAFVGGRLVVPADDDARRALGQAAVKPWMVYSKPPFAGPKQVISYLGRYTHRIAISHERLVSFHDGHVTFRWKDRAHHDRPRVETVEATAFARRFLLHVLPRGFMRIRHYGFLANAHRKEKIATLRGLLGVDRATDPHRSDAWQVLVERWTGRDVLSCPRCHVGRLADSGFVHAQAPPWKLPGSGATA